MSGKALRTSIQAIHISKGRRTALSSHFFHPKWDQRFGSCHGSGWWGTLGVGNTKSAILLLGWDMLVAWGRARTEGKGPGWLRKAFLRLCTIPSVLVLTVLPTLWRPLPLPAEGREDVHADTADAAAPGTGFLIAVHGRVLLRIQQGGLLKIEKAGTSFKSLENSSGSWREDKVRSMAGREGEVGEEEERKEWRKVWAKQDKVKYLENRKRRRKNREKEVWAREVGRVWWRKNTPMSEDEKKRPGTYQSKEQQHCRTFPWCVLRSCGHLPPASSPPLLPFSLCHLPSFSLLS